MSDLLVFMFHTLFFLYLQRRVVFLKIKSWMELSKAKQPSEKNKSYTSLKTAVIDSLVLVKFKFFAQTSKNLLVTYQTKKLWRLVLHSLHRNYLLIQPIAFIDAANTLFRLSKVNFEDSAMYKNGTDVNPGTELKLELAEIKKSRKISVSQTFKVLIKCCVIFVIPLCSSGREVSN